MLILYLSFGTHWIGLYHEINKLQDFPNSGAISFGTVHIPVGLYTATQDNDIHFNQLCKEDGEFDSLRQEINNI